MMKLDQANQPTTQLSMHGIRSCPANISLEYFFSIPRPNKLQLKSVEG